MNRALLIISVLLIISGCASPGATVRQDADPVPMVVANPLPAAERMTVGIARFENKAIFGSGLFTDVTGDLIENQAYETLAHHLDETKRFKVVNGHDIGKLACSKVR